MLDIDESFRAIDFLPSRPWAELKPGDLFANKAWHHNVWMKTEEHYCDFAGDDPMSITLNCVLLRDGTLSYHHPSEDVVPLVLNGKLYPLSVLGRTGCTGSTGVELPPKVRKKKAKRSRRKR